MKTIRLFLLSTLTWVGLQDDGFARALKDVHIEGNVRIEREAILTEIPYRKGDAYDEATTSKVLKALNKTEYFDDVQVEIQNDVLIIHVKENPVINKIAYEGMKFRIRDTLKDIIKLRPRQVFSRPVIQETQQIILEIYRRQGYLNASVTPKIVRLPDNRVDVVFEVKEGSPAYVRRVSFEGNKAFTSHELREFMEIREKHWFHLGFLGGTRNKIYDPERFVEDQQTLVKLYLSRGYADVEIVSATAELTPDKRDFFVSYYIREGEVYQFGDISVDTKIEKLDKKVLEASVMAKKGSVFNGQMVEICGDILKGLANAQGYNFAVVEPIFTKHPETKTVDVKFVVKDGPKISIEKITIKGNRHTRDNVIRRQIDFNEGDAFHYKDLKPAEARIRALGYFKDVKVEADEGSQPGLANVLITVEEERTGEIFAKAGYSTLDKLSVEAHLYEPNFRGKGQELEFLTSYAKRTFEINLDLTEPHFLNRNLSGSVGIFHTRTKTMRGIITKKTGGYTGIGYRLARRVTQHWSYRLHRENVEWDDSKNIKKDLKKAWESKADIKNLQDSEKWMDTDEGKKYKKMMALDEDELGTFWGSAITHTLAYDCRNRIMLPNKGFRVAWTTTVSGLGGSIKYMKNTWSGSWHQKLYHDITLTLRASFSHAMGLGDHRLRYTDALFVGGDTLRGFDFYGVSPLRGIPKTYMAKLVDNFLAAAPELETVKKKPEILSKITNASDKQKADLKSLMQMDVKEGMDVPGALQVAWQVLLAKGVQEGQKDAKQIHDLRRMYLRRVGATLAWHGSVEVSFPMPIVPREAELFGTMFFDMGSAWRSKREGAEDGGVLYDKHTLRTALGFSVAWNSPFGMISVGYAKPIKKEDGDVTQKFLFGYGMKFN